MSATAPDNTIGSDPAPVGIVSDRWVGPGHAFLVAALTVYLGFNAGGFFPDAVAYATVAMAALLILGIMLVRQPLVGSSGALFWALGAISGLAALTLLSGSWSHAWSRAMIEFDRVLLYTLVLAFFGLIRHRQGALEWGLRGFVVGVLVICIASWITRVAPDVWPISYDIQPTRLSYPLTYWNALGVLAALGCIALVHMTASARLLAIRVAAAAAFPLIASVLLLTFSRSSLALAPLGLVVYLLLARPKGAVAAALALVVPTAVAVIASLDAHTVSSPRFMSPAGVSQGHHLAWIVLGCVVAAGLIRLLAAGLDRRLDQWTPPRIPLSRVLAGVGVVVVAVVIVGVAAGAPHKISTKWDHFVHENNVGHSNDPSARLSSVGNDGRIPQWEAAIDAFDEKPLLGKGAGTYVNQWLRHRPYGFTVINAHSLYVEVMGELGIVGLLLVLAVMLGFLVGAARRLRGPERPALAAFLAMALVWMLHAGIDWDWQMPAITIWLFALGGIALSRPLPGEPEVVGRSVGRLPRLVGALCVGVLAVTPVLVGVSQASLTKALRQFEANDCSAAINSSLESLHTLGVRPEPYEIIGYCDARYGEDRLAEEAMKSAVSRDPENWEMHYGLAMVRAAAGKNPMPELRVARRLNPLEPIVILSQQNFRRAGNAPAERERVAGEATLPL